MTANMRQKMVDKARVAEETRVAAMKHAAWEKRMDAAILADDRVEEKRYLRKMQEMRQENDIQVSLLRVGMKCCVVLFSLQLDMLELKYLLQLPVLIIVAIRKIKYDFFHSEIPGDKVPFTLRPVPVKERHSFLPHCPIRTFLDAVSKAFCGSKGHICNLSSLAQFTSCSVPQINTASIVPLSGINSILLTVPSFQLPLLHFHAMLKNPLSTVATAFCDTGLSFENHCPFYHSACSQKLPVVCVHVTFGQQDSLLVLPLTTLRFMSHDAAVPLCCHVCKTATCSLWEWHL